MKFFKKVFSKNYYNAYDEGYSFGYDQAESDMIEKIRRRLRKAVDQNIISRATYKTIMGDWL